ncbi:MAG TPA: hypothetical protein VJR89_25305 [Polyangiales bacterium]|nr:hypothetical protein [Polyangiales bacterium]
MQAGERARESRSAWVRAFRGLTFVAAFAAAASGVWFGVQQAVSAARIAELPLGFALADTAFAFRRNAAKKPVPNRVALVGDSTLLTARGMKAPRRQSLPGRIRLSLDEKHGEAGQRLKLQSFIMPGLGPAGMYFASEHLIQTRPDRVVLSLNLHGFGREATRTFSYAESAGWLTAGQVLEALTLPLLEAGLTADRLLFYNALTNLGAGRLWREARQLQARAFRLYEPAATWADEQLGSDAYPQLQAALDMSRWARNIVEIDGKKRHRLPLAEQIMAPVLNGLSSSNPNLQLLERVLARFRKAEIPVLVYVEPFNVEHLSRLGVSLDGVPHSLRTIRRVVERQGARFLDLHELLPDAAFRDEGDHYTFEGEPNGTFLVARQLASQLVREEPTEQAMNASHAVQ